MDNSHNLAIQLVEHLAAGGFLITTVESCTGGALANAITNVPGSGDVFKDGFVTYSNEAKVALGVPRGTLAAYSVYSLETAIAMAHAGNKKSAHKPNLAVGVTGSLNRADPDNPDSSQIGDVYIAIIREGNPAYQEKLSVPDSFSRPEAKSFVVSHVLQKIIGLL